MALTSWTFDTTATGTFPIGDKKYRIQHGDSGAASISTTDSSQTLVYQVDWSQLNAFIDDVLGYTNLNGVNLNRIVPDWSPDFAMFFATKASVRPKGQPSTGMGLTTDGNYGNKTAPQWKVAEISVTYQPLHYAILNDNQIGTELDRYVTRKTDIKADYLQLQQGAMKWVTRPNHEALNQAPGIITPALVVEYTWHEVPSKYSPTDGNLEFRIPTSDRILALQGKCNLTPFDGYAKGCVLFTHGNAEMILPRLQGGQRYWNIKYSCEVRDYGTGLGGERAGVNYIYDTINNRYDLITTTGLFGGTRLYQYAELNDLFKLSA
jgi:hypothetical protein